MQNRRAVSHQRTTTNRVIRTKILAADIIHVGGGNTLQMMRLWRHLGVDKIPKSAYENGRCWLALVRVQFVGAILGILIRCRSTTHDDSSTSR